MTAALILTRTPMSDLEVIFFICISLAILFKLHRIAVAVERLKEHGK